MKISKLLVYLLFIGAFSSVFADERPNIIVILADDLGYNDVGFTGETPIQTPNIDELAAGGVIFKNGYVTHPYCGPSRAGLLTGRYQARFGMENNVTYTPYDPNMGLPLSEKTFAKRLQDVGYTTAVFGKWHLGGAEHFQPNSRGFDYFYGFLDGGHHYYPEQTTINSDGYALPIMRNKEVVSFDEYLTTALSRDAAKFVADNTDAPF
ncbi:sulfatase-like hydrolase/transferase [Psychrosphaera sp. G1-22]|nr:sulfatase-like hydrolase/transferase [Psychrosphaera sp. G1-22]MDC2887550.1 sulfatase-like hydrolase/transferase [Psychrosphaera sp. G1-22]